MGAKVLLVFAILSQIMAVTVRTAPTDTSHAHSNDASGHNSSHTATCQLSSEQIDFLMQLSLELPSYVTIAGHKFKLNIGMAPPGSVASL